MLCLRAAYDIQYFLHDPAYPCTTSAHEPPLVATKQDLKAGHFVYDMCYANAYSDFHIGIDNDVPCNVLIEVEDLSPNLVTDSLSLWLYNGSIPEDRWSERRSLYSSNKIWSISLSSNELTNGDFFLSVKCAPHPNVVLSLGQAHVVAWAYQAHTSHGYRHGLCRTLGGL
jgi:hypothetical protein